MKIPNKNKNVNLDEVFFETIGVIVTAYFIIPFILAVIAILFYKEKATRKIIDRSGILKNIMNKINLLKQSLKEFKKSGKVKSDDVDIRVRIIYCQNNDMDYEVVESIDKLKAVKIPSKDYISIINDELEIEKDIFGSIFKELEEAIQDKNSNVEKYKKSIDKKKTKLIKKLRDDYNIDYKQGDKLTLSDFEPKAQEKIKNHLDRLNSLKHSVKALEDAMSNDYEMYKRFNDNL